MEETGVSVAQEAISAVEGMTIYFTPLFADKSRYEQQQGRLWLVEVRYHSIDYPILISRCYDYACMGDEGIVASAVEIAADGKERLGGCRF